MSGQIASFNHNEATEDLLHTPGFQAQAHTGRWYQYAQAQVTFAANADVNLNTNGARASTPAGGNENGKAVVATPVNHWAWFSVNVVPQQTV